jgi:UDP:flavonoid glycosyltransferase YjiC (YdhE family)
MQHRLIWEVGKHVTRLFVDPAVNSLRSRYGVQSRPDTFSDHSDTLNLQLYSQHFATRPPDWTSEKQYGGFCYYDPPKAQLDPQIEEFLQAGEPPVLCTLGSSAVKAPGTFFTASAAALKQMGLRAIMLLGDEANRPSDLPKSILAVSEAPYYLIMPRVRFVMHQCGIGTLSHTLRAGKASIGFPYAFDQPNNARRLEALKVAEVILPHQRKPKTIQRAIERLMASSADKVANRLGEILRAEDGVALSCDVLERTFAHVPAKK